MMKMVLLLALLTVVACDSSHVVGLAGHSVTLACKYNATLGRLKACWNRGDVPLSGCHNPIISTDGHQVTPETSRYRLPGRLDQGDVSLTILNLTDSDAGRYGCRVEIPGWFNDDKHHFDLTVHRAPQTTPATTSTSQTPTEQTTANHTAGHMTSTETFLTSSLGRRADDPSRGVSVPLLCSALVFVSLVTAGGLFVIARRRRKLKIPQQPVYSSVRFSSSSSLQLHSRGAVVENIYQIDGGEYELCP